MDVVPGPYKRNGYSFVAHNAINTPWPFVDRQFDCALAFDVMEHLEEKRVEDVLLEIMRVSRDQIFSIPHCKCVGKLHVTIKPLAWWLERFKNAKKADWRLLETAINDRGGEISLLTNIRSKSDE
jgi:hypothetical protein